MAIAEVLITAGLQLLFKILEKMWKAEESGASGEAKHGIVRDFILGTPFGVKDTDGFIKDVVTLFKKHEIFIKAAKKE